MERALIVIGTLAGGVVLVALGLFFLASRAKPLPGIRETLASLPEGERAGLEAACRLAGVAADSLRPVGAASAYLFRHESNRASLFVDGGHVRALCLVGVSFSSTPDLGPLAWLQALWLPDGRLPAWPDLSRLTALSELHLAGQPLGSPPPDRLPPNLAVLDLSRTRVSDLGPLARLSSLTRLDLSETPVEDVTPLLPLGLEELDLSRTRVGRLPDTLPTSGAWKVDLTDAPALSPPGFSWKGPGSYSFTGTALGNETRSGGVVRTGAFEIQGTGSEVPALRPVHLPTDKGSGASVPPVVVEASVESGRLRLWLGEPPGCFSSPWFTSGRVKGFGFARRSGYAYADVEAGRPTSLRGTLLLTGPVEHHDYYFLVEPLEGTRVTGLRFRVRSEPV